MGVYPINAQTQRLKQVHSLLVEDGVQGPAAHRMSLLRAEVFGQVGMADVRDFRKEMIWFTVIGTIPKQRI
jgi:hypothetical protein